MMTHRPFLIKKGKKKGKKNSFHCLVTLKYSQLIPGIAHDNPDTFVSAGCRNPSTTHSLPVATPTSRQNRRKLCTSCM